MAGEYPKRSQFFAHKFVRLLQKSCAAMDIGQSSCLFLCYIAHTEDAARYSGPVRFWNEQLMTVMGFKSPKQLNEARSRAIDAGWLVYDRSGNREVGRYWVTVPSQFEGLDDALIEDNNSVNHSENGMNSGMNSGMNKGRIAERISDELRNEKVTESGKPSIPDPIPDPVPVFSSEPSAEVSKPEPGSGIKIPVVGTKEKDYDIPQSKIDEWTQAFPGIDVVVQCRKAAQWCRDNPTKRKTLKGVNRFLNTWLSKEQDSPKRNGHTATNGKQRFSNDVLEVIKVCTSLPRSEQWQERAEKLGPERAAALKKAGGASSLLEAKSNDFTLQSFAAVYDSILTDIRKATNGTAKSN